MRFDHGDVFYRFSTVGQEPLIAQLIAYPNIFKNKTQVTCENMKDITVRLAVFTIASSAVLVFVGTIFGILWLLSLWGIGMYPKIIFLHADIQIFGFLALFIAGVSFLLIPRFKNKRFRHVRLAFAAVVLIISGNATWLLDNGLVLVGNFLVLLGSLIFTIITVETLGKPRGVLKEAEPFLFLSPISLTATLFIKLYNTAVQSLYWISGFLNLAILGFPISMIYGVMVRTLHFRIGVIFRRKAALMAFVTHLAAVILSIYETLLGNVKSFSSSLLFLIAGITLCISIDAFKRITSDGLFNRMVERDRERYLYFSKVFIIAFVWLLAGLFFNVMYNSGVFARFSFRDAAIHSLTIGFIGNTIMAYSPIILPPLISGRIPYRGLKLLPIYSINLGNLWRVAGILIEDITGIVLWPTALAGLPIAAGMILFFIMVHNLREDTSNPNIKYKLVP